MATEPKPSRGMPRSLIYALIPAGFIILVILFIVFGRDGAETATEAAIETEETVPLPVENALPPAN